MKIRKILAVLLILVICAAAAAWWFLYRTERYYTAEQLGIEEIKSVSDADGDGIDDYTDIMLGARRYIESGPRYKSEYYDGGYPTGIYGVCTDVIWHAFEDAGYDLKAMVDKDIAENTSDYFTDEKPDPNIDFRRVRNLRVFFEKYAESLTVSTDDPQDWQAGDIVVYKKHIAICSDRRNKDGLPFIIHLANKVEHGREQNKLKSNEITGHYRWTAE